MIKAQDMRAGQRYLQSKGIKGVGGRTLAGAAQETGKSLAETMKIVAILQSGGQGRDRFRQIDVNKQAKNG
jgi:hypothetical protein